MSTPLPVTFANLAVGLEPMTLFDQQFAAAVNGAYFLDGTVPATALAVSGVTAQTYGDGAHVAAFAVNAEGLLTSASSIAIAIAASQITSGQVAITNGGTGQATAAAGFDALAPTTTRGDLVARGASSNQRLALGTSGFLLGSNGTDAAWAGFVPSGTGAVTRTWNSKAADFISVKDFGAVGDGVTDDTAAIQAALNAARFIWFPSGTYLVTSTLTIGNGASTTTSTRNGYRIEGSTSGTGSTETVPTIFPTCIKWGGAAAGTVISVAGPVTGVDLSGIVIDCNNLANTAIACHHMMVSTWRDVLAVNYVDAAYTLEAYATFSGMAQGANKNTFTNVRAEAPGSHGRGIRIGVTSGFVAGMLDVAQNVFINCDFQRDGTDVNAYSMWLGFCDNLTFIETQTGAVGGASGVGIYILPPTGGAGNTAFPSEIAFFNCPALSGFVADAGWAPTSGIICAPYPTGDGEPIPSSAFIKGYDCNQKFFGGILFAAGGTGTAPIVFTSGTNLTTAVAGAVEFDGKAYYATAAASSRQVIGTEQITALSADNSAPTNVNTAQNVFPTGQAVLTVQATTTYEFEAEYQIDTTGATSNSLGILFALAGGASLTSIAYKASATNGTAAGTPSAPAVSRFTAATVSTVTAAVAAATQRTVTLRGIMRVNAAGTIAPQFQYSAAPGAAPVVRANSFFRLWPIGSNTVTQVGNWA